jgi:hypothetical protein
VAACHPNEAPRNWGQVWWRAADRMRMNPEEQEEETKSRAKIFFLFRTISCVFCG